MSLHKIELVLNITKLKRTSKLFHLKFLKLEINGYHKSKVRHKLITSKYRTSKLVSCIIKAIR